MSDRNQRTTVPVAGYSRAAILGSAWSSGQAVVNKAATAVSILVIAGKLTEPEFGAAAVSFAIAGLFAVLPPGVMSDVLISYGGRSRADSVRASKLVRAVAVATTVITCALAPVIVHGLSSYPAGTLLGLIVAASFRVSGDGFAVMPLTILRSQLRYKEIAIIDGLVQLLATSTTVLLAALGAGALSIVLPQTAASIAKAIVYSIICGQAGEDDATKERLTDSASHTGKHFVIAAAAQYLHNAVIAIPPMLLGYFSTEAETGVFAFAFMLATQVTVLIGYQLGMILQPIFAKLQDDPMRQIDGFMTVLRTLGAFAVPLSLIQAALAEPTFALFFPERWQEAIPTFAVMSVAQCYYFGITPSIAMLKAQGRFTLFLLWQAGHCLIALGVLTIAASAGGALAVAVADAAIWAVSVPIAATLATRDTGVGISNILLTFLRPWAAGVPAACLAAAGWFLLRDFGTAGKIAALAVVGPLSCIFGAIMLMLTHRAAYAEIVARFATRRR